MLLLRETKWLTWKELPFICSNWVHLKRTELFFILYFLLLLSSVLIVVKKVCSVKQLPVHFQNYLCAVVTFFSMSEPFVYQFLCLKSSTNNSKYGRLMRNVWELTGRSILMHCIHVMRLFFKVRSVAEDKHSGIRVVLCKWSVKMEQVFSRCKNKGQTGKNLVNDQDRKNCLGCENIYLIYYLFFDHYKTWSE